MSDVVYHNFYSDKCVLGEMLQEGYIMKSSNDILSLVDLNTTVLEHGAVIARNKKITNKGDFIKFLLNNDVSCYMYM